MAANVVTPEDLERFKAELLSEIEKIIKGANGYSSQKWLRSPDVRRLLNISPGTLQNLRVNGSLPYTRIGSTLFYNLEDIQRVLEENRIHNR